MKVLLTHGYFIHEDIIESGIMKPYPPLGILYLSEWLKKSNIPHEVFDSTFGKREKLYAFLENYKPDIIGIYTTLMTRLTILEILSFIRGNPVLRGLKIIIGGPDARHHAENYLTQGADIIVPGEGEEALTEIISTLSSGKSEQLQEIKGICFPGNDGRVFITSDRSPLDLKAVHFPTYEKVDVSDYLQQWHNSHGFSSMAINSMRGCPYSCNWCSKSVFGNFYRRRNPISVVEEMIFLKNAFGPDQIWFTDDVFTISKEWLKVFSNEIEKQDLLLPYECITRSDCLDEEVLGMLKISGCRKVWIGAESGSQKVIDLMNRKIDLDRTVEMIIKLKSMDILTGTFVMLGYHGEEKKDIFKTALFLKKILPDDLTIGMAYPIAGTKYYEIVEPLFDFPYDWKSGSERQIRFKRSFSDRFYRFSVRYLYNMVAYKRAKQGLRKWIFFFKAIISETYLLCFH